MTPGELDDLMKKYYEGDSSLQEERRLKALVKDPAFGESLPEKDIFDLFEAEEKVKRKSRELPAGKPALHFSFFLKIAASALLIAVAGWLVYRLASPSEVEMLEVRTTAQLQEQIKLPDGTLVTLNQNSALRYPARFDEFREVYLEGEAYFEVQTDEDHPFRVATGNALTEVLGTAFNLKWDQGNNAVELEVTEGKVAFSSFTGELNERIFVKAGEQAVYHGQSNTIERFEAFDPNLISWKTKKLVFIDSPMEKVLKDASAYFEVDFTIGNEAIKNCRFSGTLENPELEDLLNALEYVMRIKFQIENKTIRLSGNGC